ncbi:MAG: insulinase family protein [Acidobacteria bacterium]|nr:insulinase family protein [Acidobacteriota bacterium]MBV9475729.1 insulinase family protein [Acidobacteriota bacterium]
MLPLDTYRLPNGLRVVLNEDHSAPLVAINLWYHVGSKNERPGRTGFAHLFEHMLFSGSEHIGNNEHFRYVQSVGGVLNGTTFFDRTNYFETLPSNYLALGLWLESDRMGFFLPALTQEKLDIQREVVKEERRQRYDNVPYGTAFERLLNLAYDSDYSYHWPTIGSMEDLGAASLDDIRAFFATWYRPDNATLTVVGDFAPDEAKRLIEQYFADIQPGGSFPQFTLTRKPAGHELRETFPTNIQLPRMYRLYHLPKMGEADWIHADLLTTILASDKASRLDRVLVHEQQIAQDVTTYVLPTESTGMLLLQATAREGVAIEQIEAAVDAEIARVAIDGITEDELTRAKNRAEVEHAHQLETFDGRADLLGMMSTYFGDPSLIDRWLEPYRAATADNLAHVARKYLIPENRVTSLFVPEN